MKPLLYIQFRHLTFFNSDLHAAVTENVNNDPMSMQLRAAVPLIDQRPLTLQLQMDVYSQNGKTDVSQILENISDIATNRAPLTINIYLADGGSYDQPHINSNTNSDNHPDETLGGNPGMHLRLQMLLMPSLQSIH